jgi:ABC-type branched-subunit amino acid transport system ATPase component
MARAILKRSKVLVMDEVSDQLSRDTAPPALMGCSNEHLRQATAR